MKKEDLLIIVVFLSFLFLPNLFFILFKDKLDNTNYENRELYHKPKLSFQNITTFATDYENYYNDHLPFKNEIRKKRAKILYNLFNTSASESVIVGKDGWLFYNSVKSEGQTVDTVADFRNISSYSEIQMNIIKDSLETSEKMLKEKNIEFYVFIAPNKENVYSDYMPKTIRRNTNKNNSKTEDLIIYLKDNSDISIVYPKQVLLENRKNIDTYYKYDTHWNYYGAYLGTIDLMKEIDSNFKDQNLFFDQKIGDNDLANMNLMSESLKRQEPIVSNFYSDIDFICESEIEYKECTNNQAVYKKNLLLVGDSFRTAMTTYLPKLYEKTVFVSTNYYKKELLEKHNPDIVVYETVERYSGALEYSHIILEQS